MAVKLRVSLAVSLRVFEGDIETAVISRSVVVEDAESIENIHQKVRLTGSQVDVVVDLGPVGVPKMVVVIPEKPSVKVQLGTTEIVNVVSVLAKTGTFTELKLTNLLGEPQDVFVYVLGT